MSRRGKLERFAHNETNPLVVQPLKDSYTTVKGNWNTDFFKNKQPIVLELGCGNGSYTVGLGKIFTDKNFIGVDIKGSRMYNGALEALETKMPNIAFLRTHILLIENFFEAQEVDEIWVTFPDPRPKESDEKRRLISPRFLDLYRKILKKGGIVHLKTDNFPLYEYVLELIKSQNLEILIATDDLYNSPYLNDHFGVQTTYEKKYLQAGFKINYLKFKLT